MFATISPISVSAMFAALTVSVDAHARRDDVGRQRAAPAGVVAEFLAAGRLRTHVAAKDTPAGDGPERPCAGALISRAHARRQGQVRSHRGECRTPGRARSR